MKSDILQELLELQVLQGIDFVRQLKLIVSRKEFRSLDTDPEIFVVGGKADAVEVLIMKGTRPISVIREDTLGQSYIRNFMMKYRQK